MLVGPPDNSVTSASAVPTSLPPFPLSGNQLEVYHNMPEKITPESNAHLQSLKVSYSDAQQIQSEAHEQADSDKWHKVRECRLTASKFGQICFKFEKPRAKPEHLAKKLLTPDININSFTKRMFKWGRDNEPVAVQVYHGLPQRSHVEIYNSGIFISPEEPFLVATPDRICFDPTKQNPWGLIEIKCPYKAREKSPSQAAKEIKNFCSVLGDNGHLHLRKYHEYYYQVQGQIALTGARWCDFVMYTKSGISVERIYSDENFWKSKVVMLHSFFFKYFQPWLLSKDPFSPQQG